MIKLNLSHSGIGAVALEYHKMSEEDRCQQCTANYPVRKEQYAIRQRLFKVFIREIYLSQGCGNSISATQFAKDVWKRYREANSKNNVGLMVDSFVVGMIENEVFRSQVCDAVSDKDTDAVVDVLEQFITIPTRSEDNTLPEMGDLFYNILPCLVAIHKEGFVTLSTMSIRVSKLLKAYGIAKTRGLYVPVELKAKEEEAVKAKEKPATTYTVDGENVLKATCNLEKMVRLLVTVQQITGEKTASTNGTVAERFAEMSDLVNSAYTYMV